MPAKGPTTAGDIVILQYNVHVSNTGWDDEARRCMASQVQKIMALQPRPPDVLCLQELFIPAMQAGYAAAFAAHGYSAHSALTAAAPWCDSVRGARAKAGASARVRYFPMAMLLGLSAALLGLLPFGDAVAGAFLAFWAVQVLRPPAHAPALLRDTLAALLVVALCWQRLLPAVPVGHWAVAPVLPLLPSRAACAAAAALLGTAFAPPVLPSFLSISGAAPVMREVVAGDPLGLVIMIRDSSPPAAAAAAAPRVRVRGDARARPHRFAHQAVDFRPAGLVHLVNSWINATYLHRGMLTLPIEVLPTAPAGGPSTRVVIATAHLQTGVVNPLRMRCVHEMRDRLHSAVGEDGAAGAVLCFDSNADARQPEMRWLRSGGRGAGLEDAFVAKHGEDSGSRGITWDNRNPMTAGNLREPDQRVDFVLVLRPSSRADAAAVRERGPAAAQAAGELGDVADCDVVLNEPPCDSDHYGVLATVNI
jgi:endonuclease/exonuclease/phosphatase family metal-dependent hydrolase